MSDHDDNEISIDEPLVEKISDEDLPPPLDNDVVENEDDKSTVILDINSFMDKPEGDSDDKTQIAEFGTDSISTMPSETLNALELDLDAPQLPDEDFATSSALEAIDSEKEELNLDLHEPNGEIEVHTGTFSSSATGVTNQTISEEENSKEMDLDSTDSEFTHVEADLSTPEGEELTVTHNETIAMDEDKEKEVSLNTGSVDFENSGPLELNKASESQESSYSDKLGKIKQDHYELSQHQDDELLKLKLTIENLREDRSQLMDKVHVLEKELKQAKFQHNSSQAELDEVKVELGFLRKKYSKDFEELKYSKTISEEKNLIIQEKNKELKKKLELASAQVNSDMRKIQERERELESQLELLKNDSENLIKMRDNKILDLKRKIDSLEFDIENSKNSEQQAKQDKYNLEDKLERIMRTLRRTIGSLDEEVLGEHFLDPDKKLNDL